MTMPQHSEGESYQPMPLSAEEYSRAEITRWLHRVESAIRELKNEVVGRSIYEVERRQFADKLADLEDEIREERSASQSRHDRLVARTWWVIATAITSLIGVLGLVVTVAQSP